MAKDPVVDQLEKLTHVVSEVSGRTAEILECLVNGPTIPDLPPEVTVPVEASQDLKTNELVLTVEVGLKAKARDVEVVFEGAEDELPVRKRPSTVAGKHELRFGLPDLWRTGQKARFVTANVIYADQTTLRRILSVPSPDEDDDE